MVVMVYIICCGQPGYSASLYLFTFNQQARHIPPQDGTERTSGDKPQQLS